MAVLYRFYSIGGRIAILPFIGMALICAAVLFAVAQADWQWGIAANIVAGAIGGAAFAKLLVEAIRRLRDSGVDRRVAGWVALGFGVAAGASVCAIVASDPPWAQVVLTAVSYAAPIAATIALLWPSRRSRPEGRPVSDRGGIAIAALCVIGGAAAMGFIAWLSIGMAANNQRINAMQPELDRASQVP